MGGLSALLYHRYNYFSNQAIPAMLFFILIFSSQSATVFPHINRLQISSQKNSNAMTFNSVCKKLHLVY
jgi:hypothetical protein